MNRHFAGFLPAFFLLFSVLLTGSIPSMQAASLPTGVGSAGAISSTNVSGGTTSVNAGGSVTINGPSPFQNQKVRTVVPTVVTGSVDPLQISANADDTVLRIKTKISLANSGKKAKNVAADLYVSDDDFLDASDVKLTTVRLTDYFPGDTKILKGETLTLPLHHKVSKAIAAYLEGKYLIAVLSAQTTMLTDRSAVYVTLRPAPNLHPKTMMVLAGAPVTLGASSGFALNYLTASMAATLQVGASLGQNPGTPLPPVVGIRYRAGSWLYVEPGTTVAVESGDRLSIYPGYTLKMMTGETWTTSSGDYLVVAPRGMVAEPVPTVASTISRPGTPVNQIIIGPIHLP